jgi:hypothetical protein
VKRAALPLALIVAGAASAGDAGLLPADGDIPGWRIADHTRSFRGAELYGWIDGGAELFLELGFDELLVRRYTDGTSELTLESYLMADPAAALGVYLAKCGVESPADSLSERHTVGRVQLLLVKGAHHLVITLDAPKRDSTATLVSFARFVAVRVPSSPEVAVLALLPPEGLVPGSIRIVRGRFSLEALVVLADGDALGLSGGVTAVAGRYRREAREETMLVADYPSPVAAAAALARLETDHDPLLTLVDHTADALVLRNPTGLFTTVSVSGTRLQVRAELSGGTN